MIGDKDSLAPLSSHKLAVVSRNVGSPFFRAFTICMVDKWVCISSSAA